MQFRFLLESGEEFRYEDKKIMQESRREADVRSNANKKSAKTCSVDICRVKDEDVPAQVTGSVLSSDRRRSRKVRDWRNVFQRKS